MLSFPQASRRREGAFTFEMQQMFKEYLGGCRMQPYAAQVSWVQNTFASQLNAPGQSLLQIWWWQVQLLNLPFPFGANPVQGYLRLNGTMLR